ncbi:hypothetical protein DL89DRAFT_259830 [Linderina pennispora]|uniref:SCP domain-containing protein n=1 Tax=Linderina pennispora TaxID=61395 RepID=A0A1Y1VZK0_9FUNG|nr:uncharacterized protein DL89DRAFT_259830 [Linderina pennispora]ORX66691.1 hypothetical protein DL89DRAFT_259830 [Linderina pennispora]
MGTNATVVPFLQSLGVPQDIVAPANSSTPYAAIGYSGILGLSKDDLNDLADKLNAHRNSSGLHPLALHPALVATSQAHSYSMNRAGNMTSYDPSGSLAQRVDRHGFDYGALGEMVLAGTHGVTEAISQLCAPGSSTLSGILSPEYAYMGAGRSGQFWTVQLARGRDGGPL